MNSSHEVKVTVRDRNTTLAEGLPVKVKRVPGIGDPFDLSEVLSAFADNAIVHKIEFDRKGTCGIEVSIPPPPDHPCLLEIMINGRQVPYSHREAVEAYLARQLGARIRIQWVSGLEDRLLLKIDPEPSDPTMETLLRGVTSLRACPLR